MFKIKHKFYGVQRYGGTRLNHQATRLQSYVEKWELKVSKGSDDVKDYLHQYGILSCCSAHLSSVSWLIPFSC